MIWKVSESKNVVSQGRRGVNTWITSTRLLDSEIFLALSNAESSFDLGFEIN